LELKYVLLRYDERQKFYHPFFHFRKESGRAGRDDKPAKCFVYFRFADIFRLSTMVFTEQTGLEKLYGIVAYCLDFSKSVH
jgi:superfamily II DNA helicase RecQ